MTARTVPPWGVKCPVCGQDCQRLDRATSWPRKVAEALEAQGLDAPGPWYFTAHAGLVAHAATVHPTYAIRQFLPS